MPRSFRRGPRTPLRQAPTPSGLGPIRDTGITVGTRRPGSRGKRLLPIFAIVAVLGVATMLLAATAASRLPAHSAGAESTATVSSAPTTPCAPPRDATPAFASYRSLMLRLPIDPRDVTAVAFHQASGKEAISLTSLAKDADMALASKNKAVAASTLATGAAETTATLETVWGGSVLRLWRSNRSGKPDTAADIGADPGTDVFAPVTGTVVQVRSYDLYNKYPDYEIHIRPDGWPEVDVVLIHVDDVSVAVGERVACGVSRIACVRKMSDKIDIQLGGYTKNGGDHVHMQLNRIDVPGKLERLTES